MGYFSNGTEGDMYQAEYCQNCLNNREDDYGINCPVIVAHEIYNYDECNKKDSILHILIPRDEQGHNKKCSMFLTDNPKSEK